jgi:hypothetical protein
MHHERRQFTRVPIDCPLTITLSNGLCVEGSVLDLSFHGLLARLGDRELPEGPIGLCISLPEGDPPFTIEAEGEIVRRSPEGFVGVYFLRTDVDSLHHLQRLLALNSEDPDQLALEMYNW